MKSLKNFLLFLSVSFILFSPIANADSSATEDEIKQIIKAEKVANDDFHKILESMWGGFIFSDGTTDPTILSQVVGYVNVLALVLGIIIVTYVSIASVINSAQSGEVLGRQWSSYWLPIRTAMAFGLLIPTQVGAFALSTAQVIVIKLVIMASTSATFLWNKAVDESLGLNRSTPTVVLPYKLAYETSLTTACAVTSARELNLGEPDVITFRFTNSDPMSIVETSAEMINNTSAFTSRINAIKSNISSTNFIESVTFWEGSCGKISFNIPSFDLDENSAFTKADANSQAKASIDASIKIAKEQLRDYQKSYLGFIAEFAVNVISITNADYYTSIRQSRQGYENEPASRFSFGSVAESYINEIQNEERPFSLIDNRGNTGTAIASTSDKIIYRMNLYKQVVDRFITSIENIYSQPETYYQGSVNLTSQQLKQEITRGGWLYAGSFFYKISQIESKGHESSSAMISGSSAAGIVKCKGCSDSDRQIANGELISLMYKHIYITPIEVGGALDGKMPRHTEAFAVPLVSSASINDGVDKGIVSDTVSAFAINVLSDIGADYGIGDSNLAGGELGEISNNNPFQFAANIGHGMNTIRYSIMAFKLVAATTVYSIEFTKDSVDRSAVGLLGIGAAASPILAILKASLVLLMELLTIALTLLTAMAWILAFYIPMMPALLWITLIGAYLLIVIEAVVATPLAVVLMATPEGEGISGSKMQNAITLLASVYLRPSLMIVGLIAAIYVAKYSFMILNTIFWSQAESAVSGDLFAFFAIFSLYITALHQVLGNSIKSMDSLPTAILNWIGQGANAQFGQNEVSGAGDQLNAKEDSFGKVGDSFKSAFNNNISKGSGAPPPKK